MCKLEEICSASDKNYATGKHHLKWEKWCVMLWKLVVERDGNQSKADHNHLAQRAGIMGNCLPDGCLISRQTTTNIAYDMLDHSPPLTSLYCHEG